MLVKLFAILSIVYLLFNIKITMDATKNLDFMQLINKNQLENQTDKAKYILAFNVIIDIFLIFTCAFIFKYY